MLMNYVLMFLLYSGSYHMASGIVEVWKTLSLKHGEAEAEAEREAGR